VRGTLSDYEKALVAALKTTWSKARAIAFIFNLR
jgi:hypothetical protein